jgi:hypothetical protein
MKLCLCFKESTLTNTNDITESVKASVLLTVLKRKVIWLPRVRVYIVAHTKGSHIRSWGHPMVVAPMAWATKERELDVPGHIGMSQVARSIRGATQPTRAIQLGHVKCPT